MQDKEVIKFTRGGIEKINLATGGSENLTISDYGKQTRYQKLDEIQYQNEKIQPVNAQESAGLPAQRQIHSRKSTAAGGAQPSSVPKSEEPVKQSHSRMGAVPSAGGKLPETRSSGTAKSYLHKFRNAGRSIPQEQENSGKDAAEEGVHKFIGKGAGKLIKETVRLPMHISKSVQLGDNLQRKIRSSSGNPTAQKEKTAKQTVSNSKQQMFQKRRIQRAAQKAAAKQAQATAAAVKTSTHIAAATAAGTPVGAAVAGVLAVILIIVLLIFPVFALFSVSQPTDELAAYLLQLDNAFMKEVDSAAKKPSMEHVVEGAYLIHTNAGEITLLLNALGYTDNLIPVVKAKVKEIHKVLNTYTVKEGSVLITPPETPEVPDPPPEERPAVIVTVLTYTVQERMAALGLSSSVKDAFLSMLLVSQQGENGGIFAGGMALNDAVRQYGALLQKYAEKYGVSMFLPVLQAVMMQESGGAGSDPMQSSEGAFNIRFPRVPGGITDPEYSIDCGVQELADCLKRAGCITADNTALLSLALQGYNFGNGYIEWAKRNYGGWSKTNAVTFSEQMKEKLGVSVYGDTKYVEHVLRYLTVSGSSAGSLGRFLWPMPGYTSLSDPYGGSRNHKGIDIAGGNINGKPIVAAESGTITTALHADNGGSYGLYVDIKHTDNYMTRYAHCSRVIVSAGQKVVKGQVIAYVGNTGNSTGPHLHFEVRKNGNTTNPLDYFDRKGVEV